MFTASRIYLSPPDLSRCPQCGGPADNGHDRSIPTNPYFCTKCMAEPAPPPPVAHSFGCWSWGPAHYLCAQNEIKRLRSILEDDGK